MAYQYAMVMWYSEEDGAYLVEVPELSGCMADGETIEETVQARSREVVLSLHPTTASV